MAGRKGMQGRKPLPVEQHKRQGTYRPDRHGPKPERPPVPAPDPPHELTPDVRVVWDRVTRVLAEAGLLARADAELLVRACDLQAKIARLNERLETLHQRLSETEGTEWLALLKQEQRLLTQVRNYSNSVRMYFVEFGMSPAARLKFGVESSPSSGSAQGDPIAKFSTGPPRLVVNS